MKAITLLLAASLILTSCEQMPPIGKRFNPHHRDHITFHDDLIGYTGPEADKLASLPADPGRVGETIALRIQAEENFTQFYVLENSTDAEEIPYVVHPNSHDAVTNPVVWRLLRGPSLSEFLLLRDNQGGLAYVQGPGGGVSDSYTLPPNGGVFDLRPAVTSQTPLTGQTFNHQGSRSQTIFLNHNSTIADYDVTLSNAQGAQGAIVRIVAKSAVTNFTVKDSAAVDVGPNPLTTLAAGDIVAFQCIEAGTDPGAPLWVRIQ